VISLVELLAAAEPSPVEVLAASGLDRHLVPAARPGPGMQYAFEVDLDACTGCKSCVAACSSLNGLDPDESWRTVGLLHGTVGGAPYQQTVTHGCHHCVDPACLAGCPVDAYEKDPVTGVVIHLDDQCIGCRYCTLTCPYEVPRYNAARGIVRKCDLCHGRLAAGEAPACVQACPNGAIAVAVVSRAELRARAEGAVLLPGAPASTTTVPGTRYRTRRPLPADARSADSHAVVPAHAHPPLAVMLVLTQLAVGAFLLARLLGEDQRALTLVSGLVALAASVLHLGRPLLAWRAVIGIGHSWLSREVVAFGAFAGLAAADSLAPGAALDGATAAAGLAGVASSVLVYSTTGRTWWRARATAARFGLTTVGLGLASVAWTGDRPGAAVAAAVVVTVKLAWEATWLRTGAGGPDSDRARTALLLRRDLAMPTAWRFGLGSAGAVGLVVAAALGTPWAAAGGLGLLVAGELVERSLFFTAVTTPRMPGALA